MWQETNFDLEKGENILRLMWGFRIIATKSEAGARSHFHLLPLPTSPPRMLSDTAEYVLVLSFYSRLCSLHTSREVQSR